MGGLEFSEVQYSKIEKENRYDSEYFQKVFFENENLICKHQHFRIGNYFKVTDGEHGSVQYMDQGVKYLTAENIKHGYVDVSNVRYVSQSVNIKNARASVEAEDILISIKGTLGSIAIAEGSLAPCNMNRDVAILKPLDRNTLLNSYVAYFMMSKYGLLQSSRGGSGGVQQMITLERLRQFIVPEFGSDFYRAMSKITKEFNFLRERSEAFYSEAEKCLKKHLQINFKATPSSYIRALSNSFGETGRLDAEYYHPKYENIESQIHGNNNILNSCKLFDNNFIPSDKTTYEYIELANVYTNGEISDVEQFIGVELPSRARRLVKSGQVIVSSVEGSLSSCALIPPEYDNAICSTGFYVVSSEKYTPETLLILFKSEPIQYLLKKRCSGTILTAISKDEFEKTPLPEISESVQEQISTYVQECFRFKSESKRLLNLAIRAVEMAVESDEKSALLWLESQK